MGIETGLMAGGAALQGVQGIGSAIAGKQAASTMENKLNQQEGMYTNMLGGVGDFANGLQSQIAQYSNPEMRGQIDKYATGMGDRLGGIADDAVGQLGRVGGYNFDPLRRGLADTMAEQNRFGADTRMQAADQAALAGQQGTNALDAALAARGISRGSGVAAAGLSQLGAQTQQGLTGLNRDLAAQAGQAGLQAASMDTQNMLNLGQMGSQYNLGNQQLSDQRALSSAGLRSNALTQGFDAMQGTYQQNYLQPQMNLMGLLSGLQGQMGSIGASGLQQGLGIRGDGVKSAGGGKGAGLGGGAAGLVDLGNSLAKQNAPYQYHPAFPQGR